MASRIRAPLGNSYTPGRGTAPTTCTTMGEAVGGGTKGMTVPVGLRLSSSSTPARTKPTRIPIRIFSTVRIPEFYFNFITDRVSLRLESVKTNPASFESRWK